MGLGQYCLPKVSNGSKLPSADGYDCGTDNSLVKFNRAFLSSCVKWPPVMAPIVFLCHMEQSGPVFIESPWLLQVQK